VGDDQRPTEGLSAVLLWISTERRPRLLHRRAVQQSIDIARPPGPQQQTRRSTKWDRQAVRQTDTVSLH